MIGGDIELADEAFDKKQVHGASHPEDAVRARIGDNLDGGVHAGRRAPGNTCCCCLCGIIGDHHVDVVIWGSLDACCVVGTLLLA